MFRQKTLASTINTNGIGLHTGVEVNLALKPAPPDSGYIFVRTDLDNFEIPASVEYISHCSYATTLMQNGVMLSTVEHLLAALRGAGIDNCFIEVDNIEMPIMDGSSEVFIELIETAGLIEQDAPRRFLQIRERVEVSQGNRRMSVEPAENYEIECLIDFPHPFIETQIFNFTLSNGSFMREISRARTFGFTHEIEMLRKANLALGGSLENAIVLTENGMLNETPLRFQNEFVRHKILDIIGDFALLGLPLLGKLTAERSGHAVHAALMSKLLKTRSAWEIIEAKEHKEHRV
jgi:UDP-3-O-[3-hydroxymyristoyl] N-acetylglucosamine deacetylase